VEDLEKLLVVRDAENAKLTKVNTLACSFGSLPFGTHEYAITGEATFEQESRTSGREEGDHDN
jgi:hypothetical protein